MPKVLNLETVKTYFGLRVIATKEYVIKSDAGYWTSLNKRKGSFYDSRNWAEKLLPYANRRHGPCEIVEVEAKVEVKSNNIEPVIAVNFDTKPDPKPTVGPKFANTILINGEQWTHDEIFQMISKNAREQYGYEGQITGETKVLNLGDSLDMVEFIMAVEEEFNMEIDDDMASTIITIDDAVQVVVRYFVRYTPRGYGD